MFISHGYNLEYCGCWRLYSYDPHSCLAYLLKTPIMLAATYFLVIVGSGTFAATIRYRHQILFKKAILFTIPSVIGIFGVRSYIVPHLSGSLRVLSIDKALVILLLTFMLLADYFMIKDSIVSINTKVKPSFNS